MNFFEWCLKSLYSSSTNSNFLVFPFFVNGRLPNLNGMLFSVFGSDRLHSIFSIRQSGFFLLTPSPWPLFSSFAVFLMLTGFAAYMNYYEGVLFCFLLGVAFVVLSFFFWCRDLICEMTFLGRSSILIETNIR